jgi:Golgi CORVET complex core vacuolar protein 8
VAHPIDYVQELEGLFRAREWVRFFRLSLGLLRETNQNFFPFFGAEFQLTGLIQYLQLKLETYIDLMTGSVASKEQGIWESKLQLLSEFFITGNVRQLQEYFFQNLRVKLLRHGLFDLLMENLKPYIRQNLVNYVSIEAFRDIVAYLKRRGEIDLVQKLVINLDLDLIDTGLMMSLCLEHKLFSSLIHISTNSFDKDYITPIVKLFAEFRQESNAPQKRFLGLQSLVYLRLCTRGLGFPFRRPLEEREQCIKHILIWMLVRENLQNLLEFEPHLTLQIFLEFFYDPENRRILVGAEDLRESLWKGLRASSLEGADAHLLVLESLRQALSPGDFTQQNLYHNFVIEVDEFHPAPGFFLAESFWHVIENPKQSLFIHT